jgi:hypothetical protein
MNCAKIAFPLWALLAAALITQQYFGTTGENGSPPAAYVMLSYAIAWTITWCFCIGSWDDDRGKTLLTCLGLVFLVMQFSSAWAFNQFVAESDPASPHSVCGKSSCSSDEDQRILAYNPNGYYEYDPPLCPYVDCYWADVNGLGIIGYHAVVGEPTVANLTYPCDGDESCASLATNQTKDYLDPGTGVADGLHEGAQSTDTDMCAYVDTVKMNEAGILGSGQKVCARCSRYLYDYYDYEEGLLCNTTRNEEYGPSCSLCVVPGLRQVLKERRRVPELFYVFNFACAGLLIARRCHKSSRRPKQKKRLRRRRYDDDDDESEETDEG